MTEFRIDRLKFRWNGEWLPQKTYLKDDVVEFGGKVYVCLQPHTSSTLFYNDLIAARINQTFVVTVGTDNLNRRNSGVFYINGVENPKLNLVKGRKYIFNQNDITNKTFNDELHPLLVSTIENGSLNGGSIYNTGVAYFINNSEVTQEEYILQFEASNLRRIELTVSLLAPNNLHYFSLNNPDQGNELVTQYNSNWELMFDGYEWKGDWQKNTYYEVDNLVKFNGYIYKSNIGHTSINTETGTFLDNISNWDLFSKGLNWTNTWNINTVYAEGDVVRYNGITYVCNTGHVSALTTGEGLELNQVNWDIISRSDNWTNDWQVLTRYVRDDIVKYGGIVYRCIEGHTSSATLAEGLENNIANWQIVLDGIEFKGNWSPSFRYKIGDVVRNGHTLWKANFGHTSSSNLRTNEVFWDIYVPGLGYEEVWDIFTEYKKGDIVLYGGYAYTALTNNVGSIPSANGIDQDVGDWELLVAGYKHRGEWDDAITYLTGDVVRNNGYLYIAVVNNTNTYPDTDPLTWQLLVSGSQWRAEWQDNVEYFLGDIVTFASTAYKCINRHVSTASDSRPDLDQELLAADYWVVLVQGTPTNILTERGDIKTYDGSNTQRLPIAEPGKVLKSNGTVPNWADYDIVPNVFYVATNGLDDPTAGKTVNSPFRTVKFATQFILDDVENRTPATIFIKTGLYEEELPIVVPKDTALVGDELRSTVIQPASGFETSNMFYVRNGSGIRNMTLQGLTGTLGAPNEYLTRRPTAGAYVSLDPGTGPGDTSAWIVNKSPYIQNVSTFGTACIGMKVDGSLHAGGNRSIVANDFTQILSDGIGYWALNGGRSELVSVFTYYNHIGYLATDGGILRATNGNNSYGTFGSVAEGFDSNEVPINGSINNRDNEAQVEEIFTFGTVEQQILAVGYDHAGQDYSSANITFGGSGIDAAGTFSEFRNGAISNIRMLDPGDSSIPGGFNYTFIANNAQTGDSGSITLANADVGTELQYIGMRIVILSGKGVGQYAEITGFNSTTKVAIVSRESDGSQGWEHFQPGWPIEATLDETTRYAIEPKVTFSEPTFTTNNFTISYAGVSQDWETIITDGGDRFVVAATTDGYTARSIDGGSTFTAVGTLESGGTLVGATFAGDTAIVATANRYWIAVGNLAGWSNNPFPSNIGSSISGFAANSTGLAIFSGTNGSVRRAQFPANTTLSTVAVGITGKMAYGNGKWVIVANSGSVAVSTDDGVNWTVTASAVSAITWKEVVYGNNRFLAVSDSGNVVARSFDGINWYESIIPSDETLNRISYGQGLFIATGGATKIATSKGGDVWKTLDDTSTAYTTSASGAYKGSVYSLQLEKTILVQQGSVWNEIVTTTQPVVRARVENSRVTKLLIYDSGSHLSSSPVVSIYDSSNTAEAVFQIYINDGVLPQPEMSNRGQGYVTATATITGNGFAEIFQLGRILKLVNVSAVPGPGANLEINGINDRRYSISTINSISGTGPYTLTLGITPFIGVAESPAHLTEVTIRENYSQIRLTGHDFLDIGTGNFSSTRYPTLYLEGESPENERQPFNETVASGGGRVFYTSTDQDGNFRVGELFQVEQARGVVTISASQFDLTGLTELRLGGIQVGGSAVVIREFSKDSTFIADSNNIVPTQRAIKAYIESRISGGGANAQTNTLISGQVRITGNSISTTSGFPIEVNVPLVFTRGYTGTLLAQQYFLRGANTQFEDLN